MNPIHGRRKWRSRASKLRLRLHLKRTWNRKLSRFVEAVTASYIQTRPLFEYLLRNPRAIHGLKDSEPRWDSNPNPRDS